MEDILKRLKNGESVDAIAAEFTDALNKAKKEYETIQKEEKRAEQKYADAENIMASIISYINKYYPDILPEAFSISGDEMVEIMDTAVNTIQTLTPWINAVNKTNKIKSYKDWSTPAIKPEDKTIEVTDGPGLEFRDPYKKASLNDDIFKTFFRVYGLDK